MKNISKVLLLVGVLFLGACSSMKIHETKNPIEAAQLKEPYKVMDEILTRESVLSDWYDNETPVNYLFTRQIIKSGREDELFLSSLKTKDATAEDIEEFYDITEKYLNKLERKYKLKNENIKDTKGIVQKLVIGYNVNFPTLEKHLMTVVATEGERADIQRLNKKSADEMTEKDRKALRKILDKWLKRKEFFDGESLYSSQVSEDTIRLVEISKKDNLTSVELNNINAKALEIAFPELISSLNRWGK